MVRVVAAGQKRNIFVGSDRTVGGTVIERQMALCLESVATDKKWRKRNIYVRKKIQRARKKIKQKAEAANSDLKQNKEKKSQGRWKLKQKKENEQKAAEQMK